MCLHSHLSPGPGGMAQPQMTNCCAPNTRLSVPLALKGPHPTWLYLKVLFLACSQPQSPRAQHPGATRARGARQAELWGRGGEGPPTAAPCSCTGMKRVIFTQKQVRWRGRAPRSPQEKLKKQWNKTHILKQGKKNSNIKFFSALWPRPCPLVGIVHLHYVLTNTPQGQESLTTIKMNFPRASHVTP